MFGFFLHDLKKVWGLGRKGWLGIVPLIFFAEGLFYLATDATLGPYWDPEEMDPETAALTFEEFRKNWIAEYTYIIFLLRSDGCYWLLIFRDT